MTAIPNPDDFVRAHYRAMPMREMAKALGVTGSAVQARAQKLIRRGDIDPRQRAYHPPWTEEEDEYLGEYWGELPDRTISRHLGRTVVACELRAKRALNINRRQQAYTLRDTCALFGVEHHTVEMWMDRGYMKAKRAPFAYGLYRVWQFADEAIKRFIRRCPQHYDRTRIERGTYWRNLADQVWERDPWLTREEAARRLGVHPDTISRHCARGWLRAEKVAGSAHQGVWKIPESAVVTFRRRH